MDRRSTSTVRSIARKPMPRQRRSISTAGRRNKRTRWARLRRSTIFSDQDRTYFASDNLACAVRSHLVPVNAANVIVRLRFGHGGIGVRGIVRARCDPLLQYIRRSLETDTRDWNALAPSDLTDPTALLGPSQ